MRRMTLAVAAAVALGAGVQVRAQDVALVTAPQAGIAALAPDAWLQGDPADSLYRRARASLNRSRFRDAVTELRRIRDRYPRSGYVPDTYYWEAFALYRVGGEGNLRLALEALDVQARRYANAATRGDADALRARVNAALARSGDAESAMAIAQEAEAAAAPVAATPATPPVAGTRVRAPRPMRGRESRHSECDGEDDTKAIALNALLQMDADRAVPILEKVLARRDSGSVCLRRRAMFLVAQKQTDRTENILLSAARSDPDPEVRQQAVFWLSQVNSERAVTALDSILRGSRDAELQEKALFALSQQHNPRAAAILRAYAERDDAPDELRARAIFWMGQTGDGANSEYLRSLYGRVKSEELRERILFGIAQSNDPGSAQWLFGIAKNKREPIEMRKKALFWAGQGSVPASDLVSLYDQVDEREIREQLVFVYSQRDDRETTDKMLSIARRDPDPEIRKRALFWISQSKDPRATQLIQDILEDR